MLPLLQIIIFTYDFGSLKYYIFLPRFRPGRLQQWIVSLSVFASVGRVESLSIRLVSREVRGEGVD